MDLPQILQLEREQGQRRFRVSTEEYVAIKLEAQAREEELTVIRRAIPVEDKTLDNPAYRTTIVEPHRINEVNFELYLTLPPQNLSPSDLGMLAYHFGLDNCQSARIFFYENVSPDLPLHVQELAKRRVVATRDFIGMPIRDVFVTTLDESPPRTPNSFYDVWGQRQVDYDDIKKTVEGVFETRGKRLPAVRAYPYLNPNDPYHKPSLTLCKAQDSGISNNELTGILLQTIQRLQFFPAEWDVFGIGFRGDEIPIFLQRPDQQHVETLIKPVHFKNEQGLQLILERGELFPIDVRELFQAYADVLNGYLAKRMDK